MQAYSLGPGVASSSPSSSAGPVLGALFLRAQLSCPLMQKASPDTNPEEAPIGDYKVGTPLSILHRHQENSAWSPPLTIRLTPSLSQGLTRKRLA